MRDAAPATHPEKPVADAVINPIMPQFVAPGTLHFLPRAPAMLDDHGSCQRAIAPGADGCIRSIPRDYAKLVRDAPGVHSLQVATGSELREYLSSSRWESLDPRTGGDMALQTRLLRASFDIVIDMEPELTRHFYDTLFERHPEARSLFGRTDPTNQQRMLQEALIAVLDHLDDAAWLGENLAALGRRHDEYGVTPEMYAWVGDALLTTLADIAGDIWNDDLQVAWGDAFEAIRDAMLAGSAQATG
jgi:hemoglobin-like flavoprotein